MPVNVQVFIRTFPVAALFAELTALLDTQPDDSIIVAARRGLCCKLRHHGRDFRTVGSSFCRAPAGVMRMQGMTGRRPSSEHGSLE
jgi:hypothetical protein